MVKQTERLVPDKRKQPSQRQATALKYIEMFIAQHGQPPTLPEIAKRLKTTQSVVQGLVKELAKHGYLSRGPAPRQRSLEVLTERDWQDRARLRHEPHVAMRGERVVLDFGPEGGKQALELAAAELTANRILEIVRKKRKAK